MAIYTIAEENERGQHAMSSACLTIRGERTGSLMLVLWYSVSLVTGRADSGVNVSVGVYMLCSATDAKIFAIHSSATSILLPFPVLSLEAQHL